MCRYVIIKGEKIKNVTECEKMSNIPKMPEEYKGDIKKSGGYTKSLPREWTTGENEWVKSLFGKGYTVGNGGDGQC